MSAYFVSVQIKWLLFRRSLDRFWVHRTGFFAKPVYNTAPANKSRRNLLKLTGLGLGAVVVGKIVGDKILSSLGGTEYKVGGYEGFKVLEKKNKLVFYNRKGNKLFTLSDDGEMEIGD